MSGVIPAIPLILIRPFLPESPTWQREESGGHAQAAELRRAVPAAVPHDDDRHDGDDGGGVRRGVRRDSADAAHRAGPAGSARRCRAPAHRADGQRRAVVSGIRRARRTVPARVSRRPHRQPAQAAPRVSGAGPDPGAASCSSSSATSSLTLLQVGHLLRRHHDDRAVQFLGQLSAARLSRPTCAARARALRPTSAAG